MFSKALSLFRPTKLALVLPVLVFIFCLVGALLPSAMGKNIIFFPRWFNFLLVLLIVNGTTLETLNKRGNGEDGEKGMSEKMLFSPFLPRLLNGVKGIKGKT